MKYWALLFLLLPVIGRAEFKDSASLSRRQLYYEFVLNELTQKSGKLDSFARKVLQEYTRTIYILKEAHLARLPKKLNGYKIVLADRQKDLQLLIRKQNKEHAAILFFSKPDIQWDFFEMYIVNVHAEKGELVFEPTGCRLNAQIDMQTGQFTWRIVKLY